MIDTVSKAGQQQIKLMSERKKADQRVVISLRDACIMLGRKETTVRNLIIDGSIASILDGERRLIIVSSIYDYLIAGIAHTYPADGARVVARPFLGKRPHELKAEAKAKAGRVGLPF
jgi:hypothetical protein